MSKERVPNVILTIEWVNTSGPVSSTGVQMNTDRAGFRAAEAATTAIRHALQSEEGEATVRITVKRAAKTPLK